MRLPCVAPADVTNLTATAKDERVLLTWTDASDTDIYGYEVSYSGTQAINRAITALEKTSMVAPQGAGGCYVSGLTNGTKYTFTVKTVDINGNKSSGVTAKATPKNINAAAALQIALSAAVPHENGYAGDKSNTKVTITASITTASNVKKVVWKKNGSLIAKNLLSDIEATQAVVTSNNSVWTFDITAIDETANGIYTVAAIDESGREEAEQIVIDNFDFTPPLPVSGLTVVYSSEQNRVILNWTKPSTEDFDHVEITYTYNDGNSDSAESQVVNVSGTDKNFKVKEGGESSAQIYKYYVKSVDKLGNISTAMTRSVSVISGIRTGYQFHEVVEYLVAGTGGTAGTNATYVYFGDWPQTVKEESITIDETQSMTMGGFTYYKGSDENWYAKCEENAYSPNYTYSDGSTVGRKSSNSTKYFKVEPIKWRVLNSNTEGSEKKILLAESILTANVPYYGSTYSRHLSDNTIYSNNYKYSNIRAYLNGINNQFITDGRNNTYGYDIDWSEKGFLYSAFKATAITQIADTVVDNSARSTNLQESENEWNYGENSYACENTIDKVFLLSEQEVTNSSYGFAANYYGGQESARIHFPTDYAKANYARQDCPEYGYGCTWWLRSPGWWEHYHVREVSENGDVESIANYPYYDYFGVVPALCLNE